MLILRSQNSFTIFALPSVLNGAENTVSQLYVDHAESCMSRIHIFFAGSILTELK